MKSNDGGGGVDDKHDYVLVWFTGVDEVCVRRAMRCEGRYEVAVRQRARRSAGAVLDAAVARPAARSRLFAYVAAGTKHVRTTRVERPVRLFVVGSHQHCQMSAESRRWPRTIQGK